MTNSKRHKAEASGIEDKADLLSMAALVARLGREQVHSIPAEILRRASAVLRRLSDETIEYHAATAVSSRITEAVLEALRSSDFAGTCPNTLDLLERHYRPIINQGVMSVVKGLKEAKP